MKITVSHLLKSESIELSIKSTGHNLGRFSMDDMDEPVELDLDCNVTGGQKEIMRADPNDSQPGYAPDVSLMGTRLAEALTLTSADGVQIIFPAGYVYHPVMSSESHDRIEAEVKIPGRAFERDYEREAA